MRKALLLLFTLLLVFSNPGSVKAAAVANRTTGGTCGVVLLERLPLLQ